MPSRNAYLLVVLLGLPVGLLLPLLGLLVVPGFVLPVVPDGLPVLVPLVAAVPVLGMICVTRRQSASIAGLPELAVVGSTSHVISTRSPAWIWLTCCPFAEAGTDSVRCAVEPDDPAIAVISLTVIVFACGFTETTSTETGCVRPSRPVSDRCPEFA